MCAGWEGVWLGQKDLLPPAGGQFPSRCLLTWNRALGSWKLREPRVRPGNPHREARSILSGEDAELGTDSIQLLSGRALGASLQRLHTASPVLWFAFIPPSPLSTGGQIIASSVISRWFCRTPNGSGSTPRGGSAVRKRKQVGRQMTRQQELCVLGTSERSQSPGTRGP